MNAILDEYLVLSQLLYDMDNDFAKEVFEQEIDYAHQQVLDLKFADEFDFEVHRTCINDITRLLTFLTEFFNLMS